MPTQTLNPTSNQSPDSGQAGTTAVSSPSNTGHDSTNCFASGVGSSESKSCSWSSFQSPASFPTKITLKVDWSRSGSLSDGGFDTFNFFGIDYSVNGGSGWSALHSESQIQDSDSGTDSVEIPASTPISSIQVRDTIQAAGGENFEMIPQSADLSAIVSNIRLELEYGSNRGLLGMM